MKSWLKKIIELNACAEAVKWAKQFNTLQEAWDKCERGDWMLWLIGKLSGEPMSDSRRQLVLVACKCARLALKYIPKGEKRPLKAIQLAERWAKGDNSITSSDIRNAAYAAAYAADAADAAAYAAAYAADAAAYAAAYAADAAAAAAYAAAYAADAADARIKTLKKCADIVREFYPKAPKI